MKNLKFKWLLLSVILSIASISQVWATDYAGQSSKSGFNKDGGVKVTFNINGTSTEKTLNRGGMSNINLGTITTALTLNKIQFIYWKNGGNICNGWAYVNSPEDADFGPTQLGWSGSDLLIDNLGWNYMGKDPGTYYITAYFKMEGNANDGSNCGDFYYYSNYKDNDWTTNNQNYTFEFTIPSKNLTIAGAANGNTVSGSQEGIKTGYAYSISATPLTGGYTFSGWTVTSGASSVVIADASSASTTVTFNNYSNDVTITASFTPINYSDDDNILLEDGSTVAGGYNVDYDGTSIAFTAGHVPSKPGYHNTDFYKESSKENKIANADRTLVSETTTYTSDGKWKYTSVPNLYMSWIANTYTITFDDQSATIIGTDEESVTFDAAVSNVTVPKKEGYIFDGYYTGTSGTGVKIFDADGTVVTNANDGAGTDYTVSGNWKYPDNITLYANWTGISYHVQFDANGGTGSMSNQDLTYGTSTALTTNAFTRDGYYFLGWNTNPDGSGTAYYGGKSVSDITTTPGETVTLYAQWAQMHTLYFLNMGTSGWNQGSDVQANAYRYAYAFIYYDGHKLEPLGTFENNSRQGTRMSDETSITLPNVNNTTTWCWSIANVPEGSTIIFSDNTTSNQTSDISGWTAEKPYYCKGNGTWYALDGTNSISMISNMSVKIGKGHFGESWQFFALDVHDDGIYAKINLNTGQLYQYQYHNWQSNTNSGAKTENAYTINGGSTTADYGGPNGMDGTYDYLVGTYDHATGEYKFILTWSGSTPQTTVRVPRGVTMNAPSPVEAKAGEQVTITLTANASSKPVSGTDMDNPTYYFEFSTDNSNWRTVASVSPTSSTMSASTTYTFNAQSGYFRVKLVNDNGVASYSGSTAFTAYSTKSFYLYNPWNTDSDKWRWLHLYTWDSNNGDARYNGDFPGGWIACSASVGDTSTTCSHGNKIKAMGGNWFYITLDARANCFKLAGEEVNNDGYASHQTYTCSIANYIPEAKYMLINDGGNKVLEYASKTTSDYRLIYTDACGSRTSDIYNTNIDGTLVTTSMWMNASDGTSLKIQQGNGSGGWNDVKTYTNSSDGFNGLVASGYRSHGYVFQMKLNMNGASSSISNVDLYIGSYYVRTDELDGEWNVYKNDANRMHYSELSLTSGTPAYDYYICKWISTADKSVKFTVANDYNSELVSSLEGDVNSTDPLYGTDRLPEAANVRFAWNSQTNTLTRAYLSGATNASSRFLVLVETTDPQGKIYDSKGQALVDGKGQVSGLNEHELLFEDKGNWVYQLTLMANPGAKAKVRAKYNSKEPDFVNANLIGGSGDSKYTYRIVYDFKTNNMASAWVASGAPFSEDIELNNNVMLIRNGQGEASQISFTTGHKITEVKKVYGVLQFDRSFITNEYRSRYARDLYWVSFPFNVNLRDVFGMGTYGTHWIIEYYDGAGRAKNGFWADSPSNWKFVTPAMRETGSDGNGYILEANVGYIVALDLDELWYTSAEDCSSVWENGVTSTYLYFPSTSDIDNIQATTANVTINQTGYQCTIGPRFEGGDDRRIKDSYWHCIGVPSYANTTGISYSGSDVPSTLATETWTPGSTLYFYEWNSSSNTLSIHTSSGYEFKAMHSYLVQYAAGTLSWTSVTNTVPASVAARMAESQDRNYTLALMRESEEEDHTLLRMTDDANVSNRFEFNYDLSKEYNAGRGNIWTVTADTVEVAGNSMPKPLQTTLVPVGVKVVANGDYTFSIPEGTNGEDVYLIDNAYGTRTNLGLMPYTVTLTSGTYDSRFALEFGPVQDAPTSLENDGLSRSDELNDANDDVRKVFVGGRLYIIREGKVYDAAGQRVE